MQAGNTVINVGQAVWPLMEGHGIDVYLVPSSDEHLNEYLPEPHKRREFLSGFSGSAGDALLLSQTLAKELREKPVWVFVDSRYHEQADLEVDLEMVSVSKLGLEFHPRLSDTLLRLGQAKPDLAVGFDPFTISCQAIRELEKQCQPAGIRLVPVEGNLIDQALGSARPQQSREPVYALDDTYTGMSAEKKIKRLQQQLKDAGCDLMPVTKLDQIAWLLNWRGQDIPYNPVFLSYVIAYPDSLEIFCDGARIDDGAKQSLPGNAKILPYGEYAGTLTKQGKGKRVLIDPKHTAYGTLHALQQAQAEAISADNPIESDKAVKNGAELHWMRQAHVKSAKGKIKALHWLETQLSAGSPVSEKSFADQLERFYAQEEGYKGLSFNTIAGFAANSSIVHYGTPSPEAALSAGQLFLIDSGVQYLGGTTDDTRTIIIGQPDALQKKRFTEVLKAHINCAMQVFPKGTEGARLDGITRASLWQEEMDYGHGTGHGVGAFLNVHEGPCGIHRLASKPLQPGNVVSIEPGYYEPGWGGIRCENLYVVVEKSPGWYGFEALTFIPFDTRLVDGTRLSAAQADWLKNYHQAISANIAPLLPDDAAAWLGQRL